MRFLLLFSLALIAGCDRFLDEQVMRMAGWEAVALSSQPFKLDAQGKRFTPAEPLEVVGSAAVCVILKVDYPMKDQPEVDNDFASLLQAAVLSATATDEAGKVYPLTDVGQAWVAHGAASSRSELSACMGASRGGEIPMRTLIRSVEIRADRPLSVRGAWWQSIPP